MDQYKISQTPTGKAGKKSAKQKASKAPKRKFKRNINPQTAMSVVATILALILVGAAVAHFAGKNGEPAVPATTGAASNKAGAAGSNAIVPGETFGAVTASISSKQPGALNKYYAKTVRVVIPSRKVNQNVAGKSVESLVSDLLNGAVDPWNWHVPPSDLAAWQNGPYGQYFTGNVIVGISNDGTVISIGFNDAGEIITVFIAPVGDLTTPSGSSGSGGGSGSGSGSGGSTAPTTTPVTNLNGSD